MVVIVLVENIHITYSMILEVFSDEKINNRYEVFYDKIQRYIDAKDLNEKVHIDKGLLQQVIIDYFTDIYRLKIFHNIEKVNISKIVAYEMYWFLRRKPIQSNEENFDMPFINENFATFFIAHEFLYDDTEVMSTDGENKFMSFLEHLSYHFKYRNIDKQFLELLLSSFETGKEMYRDSVSNNTVEL